MMSCSAASGTRSCSTGLGIISTSTTAMVKTINPDFKTRAVFLAKPGFVFKYTKVHKILGQGNLVLVMSEGLFDAKPTAFYDLYRIENGKQVEHWDVIETIPPSDQWKHANGKF